MSSAEIQSADSVLGVITNIQSYSLHDGPGIRTVVFLKGCPLRCKWCCNPENQRPGIEIEFYSGKCTRCGTCLNVCDRKAINPDLEVKTRFKINRKLCDLCGKCVNSCPKSALTFIGKKVTVASVLEKVQKDRYFYITSKGGLTISGGEPLFQFEFTRELLKASYRDNIDTAIETCGYVPWQRFEEIIPYLNLVLYDVKHMDAAVHKEWTGVSNKRILDNLLKLSKQGVPIVIRLPLIPSVNLTEAHMIRTTEFISTLENVREVNLLPFHQLGKDKYYRLSIDYELKQAKDLYLDEENMAKVRFLKAKFESIGLRVTIGG